MARLADLVPSDLREWRAWAYGLWVDPELENEPLDWCLYAVSDLEFQQPDTVKHLIARRAADKEIELCKRNALESGKVVATGLKPGALLGERECIPADRWQYLHYSEDKNAAISNATNEVVLEALDFEVAAAKDAPKALDPTTAEQQHFVRMILQEARDADVPINQKKARDLVRAERQNIPYKIIDEIQRNEFRSHNKGGRPRKTTSE